MGRILLFALVLGCGLAAANARADSEAEGAAAAKAGRYREALGYYTSALQDVAEGSAKDQQLRETIVDIAARVKPRAAVPKEAERHLARAQAAVELAKTPQDFEFAVRELKQALRIVPWWAEGYFNLGTVQEKAGQYADAQRNLKLYLRAAPEAADARAVKTAIAKIEYKQEHKAREEADKLRLAQAVSRLAGDDWCELKGNSIGCGNLRVRVTANDIEVSLFGYWGEGPQMWHVAYRGKVEGNGIRGAYYFERTCPNMATNMTGTVSPDGNRIDFSYELPVHYYSPEAPDPRLRCTVAQSKPATLSIVRKRW